MAHWPAFEMTSSSVKSATLLVEPFVVTVENVTSVPFDKTRVGEPESRSSIELLKTDPLSDPG